MPEPENRARQSLYDREVESPHDEARAGRRRRQIADWGGDELFTRMPRRRSGHEAATRSRRFVHEPQGPAAPAAGALARSADGAAPLAPVHSLAPAEPAAPAGPFPDGTAPGRRTVVIGGRGGLGQPPHASLRRERPPRTVAERIGGQPERIVAWAFALGVLLILVAIATAQT